MEKRKRMTEKELQCSPSQVLVVVLSKATVGFA